MTVTIMSVLCRSAVSGAIWRLSDEMAFACTIWVFNRTLEDRNSRGAVQF